MKKVESKFEASYDKSYILLQKLLKYHLDEKKHSLDKDDFLNFNFSIFKFTNAGKFTKGMVHSRRKI
jgi:hypothetical protein